LVFRTQVALQIKVFYRSKILITQNSNSKKRSNQAQKALSRSEILRANIKFVSVVITGSVDILSEPDDGAGKIDKT
jgi:hypothetical protein